MVSVIEIVTVETLATALDAVTVRVTVMGSLLVIVILRLARKF